MFAQYRFTVGALARLADVTIIGSIWLLSFWLRFHVPIIEVTKGFPPFSTYAALTPLVVVLWTIALEMQEVYRRCLLRQRDEILMLLKSHAAALLCFVALTYVFSQYRYSRGVLIYFGVLGALGLALSRPVLHALLRLIRQNRAPACNVLLVGHESALELLIERISRFPELGWRIAGVLVPAGSQLAAVAGQPVLGHLDDTQRRAPRHPGATGADRPRAAAVGRAGTRARQHPGRNRRHPGRPRRPRVRDAQLRRRGLRRATGRQPQRVPVAADGARSRSARPTSRCRRWL